MSHLLKHNKAKQKISSQYNLRKKAEAKVTFEIVQRIKFLTVLRKLVHTFLHVTFAEFS